MKISSDIKAKLFAYAAEILFILLYIATIVCLITFYNSTHFYIETGTELTVEQCQYMKDTIDVKNLDYVGNELYTYSADCCCGGNYTVCLWEFTAQSFHQRETLQQFIDNSPFPNKDTITFFSVYDIDSK